MTIQCLDNKISDVVELSYTARVRQPLILLLYPITQDPAWANSSSILRLNASADVAKTSQVAARRILFTGTPALFKTMFVIRLATSEFRGHDEHDRDVAG